MSTVQAPHPQFASFIQNQRIPPMLCRGQWEAAAKIGGAVDYFEMAEQFELAVTLTLTHSLSLTHTHAHTHTHTLAVISRP